MDLLIPSFGLIIWTLLAFLIVFYHSEKICMEADPEFIEKRETTIADSWLPQKE